MQACPQSPGSICLRIAARQYGVFNLAQVRAAGLNGSAVYRGVRRGLFVRELPRVFAVAGAPRSWERRQMAAILWAGGRSAAAGTAAARNWGFRGFENAPVEIAMTGQKRPFGLGFVAHRVDDHLVPEITEVRGIPTTSVRRTLLDLAATNHRFTESSLDQALRQDLVPLSGIWLLYEQEWMKGRRGVAVLRRLLLDRTSGQAPSDSDMESLMGRMILSSNLPVPTRQFPVQLSYGSVLLDFSYPKLLIDIECDSYAFHMDRQAFEKDRRRDVELQALGWVVLRFTWAQIKWQEEFVLNQIRHHVEQRSKGPLG